VKFSHHKDSDGVGCRANRRVPARRMGFDSVLLTGDGEAGAGQIRVPEGGLANGPIENALLKTSAAGP